MIGKRRLRGGFTLVEVLISVTMTSLLIGFAITLLARSIQASGDARELQDRQLTIHRLAETWRADLRQAAEWELVAPDQLQLTLPGGTIRYLVQEGQIERQERAAAEEAGENNHVIGDRDETFRLPRSSARFVAEEGGPITLLIQSEVGMRRTAPGPDDSGPTRTIRLEAWRSP